MCIGIPMQVIESSETQAICEANGEQRKIDMMLVGKQSVGTWLLIFLNTARDVLTPDRAHQISDALKALEMANQGEENFDSLFQDLIGREPELPDFLRNSNEKQED